MAHLTRRPTPGKVPVVQKVAPQLGLGLCWSRNISEKSGVSHQQLAQGSLT